MKTVKFLTWLYLLLGMFYGRAQTHCGYGSIDSMLTATDPDYPLRKGSTEEALADSMQVNHLDSLLARSTDVQFVDILIPVVIHNIGNSSIAISTAQNFISALNARFSNANNGNNGIGVNTQIQFCLAAYDPNGNSTSGVTYQNNPNINGPFGTSDDATIKSIIHWDPSRYLNIWVCNISGAVVVWGTTPSQFYLNTSTPSQQFRDGVVCDMNTIFNNTTLNIFPMVEQVAHWLNLIHTYGDGVTSCGSLGVNGAPGNSDLVDDTPWCYGPSGSSLFGNNCSAPVQTQCAAANQNPPINNSSQPRQINNYMDDCDDACENMFTLGQKARMQECVKNIRMNINDRQNGITKCVNTCTNGVQDTDVGETGVDCGGPCPPCVSGPVNCYPEASFLINGQACNSGKFINVCNDGNIIIQAHSYDPYHLNCTDVQVFSAMKVSQCWGDTKSYAFSCVHKPLKGLWCCDYLTMFISVQQCDQYKNPIGTEFWQWFNVPNNSLGNFNTTLSSFNLYNYLPALGTSLVDGQFYRLKVMGYSSFTAYFKTFQSSLILANDQIYVDEYADYLTYNSCTINNTKSMAQYEIQANGESILNTGEYSIGNYNCSQLPTFRTIGSALSPAVSPLPESTDYYFNASNSFVNAASAANAIKLSVIPNPTDGNATISLLNADGPPSSIDVLDLSGVVLYSQNNLLKDVKLDLRNFEKGIYLIRANYHGMMYNTKLIKQ